MESQDQWPAPPMHQCESLVPLNEILGARTLEVARSLAAADAAILRRPTRPDSHRLSDYEQLTGWRRLSDSQVRALHDILTDPASYWTGWPVYRRFPPRPGFALRLRGSGGEATLLVDLHNPGWEWFCGAQTYWAFHFAGPQLAALAKGVFPEYASPRSQAVWKKGAIEALYGGAS
jgi:hypothetical protein